jgi:RimJ/RimL family protein N-acetyltransferase
MSDQSWNSPEHALAYGRALLAGDAVRLRPTTDEDLPTLATWWATPEWAPLQQGIVKPRPAGPVVKMFRSWSQNAPGELGAGFSIVLADTDQLIGHAVLHGANHPTRIATYAVIIGPDHIGQGHGTDATRLMVRYGFQELGVHKIELRVWSYNQRALRSYTKAGFVREGVRRAAAFHAGVFHDEVLMGILAEEYVTPG